MVRTTISLASITLIYRMKLYDHHLDCSYSPFNPFVLLTITKSINLSSINLIQRESIFKPYHQQNKISREQKQIENIRLNPTEIPISRFIPNKIVLTSHAHFE